MNPDERQAAIAASPHAGEYLDKLGKTDLATMTEAEWLGFIGHVYRCVRHQVAEIWERDVPF